MTMPIESDDKPRRYVVKDAKGKVVGHASLRMVSVESIHIDSSYQRDVKQAWVEQNLPFDPKRAGAVILSARGGRLWCIDGGHRVALARASGIQQVNAMVIEGLSKAEEARLFVDYQRTRTNLTSYALFRAEVEAGDEDTLSMVTIVNRAGLQLSAKSGPRNITAIDAVRYIHKYGGDALLESTLHLVREVWFEMDRALSGQVLKGLALFLASAEDQPQYQRDRVVKVMSGKAPVRLLLEAQELAVKEGRAPSVSASNVAETIQRAYNKGLPKSQVPLGPLRISNKLRPAAYKRGFGNA